MSKDFLRSIPNFGRNNPVLFTFADFFLVFHLPVVGMIIQNSVNMCGIPDLSLFCPFASDIQFMSNQLGGLSFNKPLKDVPDCLGIFFVDDKLFIFHSVS